VLQDITTKKHVVLKPVAVHGCNKDWGEGVGWGGAMTGTTSSFEVTKWHMK
jgi:hypothetical protein